MRSPGVDNKSISREVRVYDVANRKLIGTFKTTTEAYKFTGVNNSRIIKAINRKDKVYKNKLNITLAFR